MNNNQWHVAAMNDCIFIIDQKPHPAPVDHVNPNAPAPSVVISMRSGSREAEEIAGQIVSAHNTSSNRTEKIIESFRGRFVAARPHSTLDQTVTELIAAIRQGNTDE